MGIQVTETNWAPTATDLTNSALATKGADALMLVGYPAPEAQMVKTMRANGITIPIIADYGFSGVIQGNLVPADNLSNVAFAGNCEPLGDSPSNAVAQKFLSDMKANFPSSYVYSGTATS